MENKIIKSTKSKAKKAEKVNKEEEVKEEEVKEVKVEVVDKEETKEEIENKSKQSKQFIRKDLTKEFKWTPTDFIDDENPLTFIFTLLSNSEQALLNDKLQCLQGDIVYTNFSQVDLETIKLKVHRIENYLQDGEYTILTNIPLDFFEAEIKLEVASDLASYIRTLSTHDGELFN